MSHSKDMLEWSVNHRRASRVDDEVVRSRTKSLNLTEEELRRVIEKVGTSAKKVIDYLQSQR